MAEPASAPAAPSRGPATLATVLPLFLLAAWLGASLLTAAAVAPAAFAVLPSRTLAGALVGRVLPVLFLSGAAVGALVGVLGWRRGAGRRATMVAALTIVVACLAAQLVIGPQIERLRAGAGVPIDALARTDARRVAFGRLHGASVLALGLAMLAGSAALALGARGLVRGEKIPERPARR